MVSIMCVIDFRFCLAMVLEKIPLDERKPTMEFVHM